MSIRLIGGDCREVLATLPANSVHCVCTSPPYYGLRDYGTAQWDGGDAACDHRGAPQRTRATLNANWGEGYADVKNADAFHPFRDTCGKCGATRVDRQIGLEPTPDAYLAEMVAVFREIRRVMRHDAVAFINLGDSYSDKQLLMMPARLALALQADGWWLRSDIIWHKPNPMPESVTDRPTSAHEHVFLLAKAARYYFDSDAVREAPTGRTDISVYPIHTPGEEGTVKTFAKDGLAGRNLRNVWTIATAPFSQSHFATMPPAVVERCIRAGTSERGCCAACGAPWGRQTAVSYTDAHRGMVGNQRKTITDDMVMHAGRENDVRMDKHVATTGWHPTCACDRPGLVVPCTVLDPFAGAGTTLLVADRLQRDAIGIELNPDYTRMAMDRCRDDAPLFAEPSPPPAEAPEEPRIRDLFA
jgi:DNA modification methylase